MPNHHLSIVLGLTATAAVCLPLPVQAASFNFDSLPNISSRPIESNHKLNFFGDPSQNQGYTAFFKLPLFSDCSYQEISKNSPGNPAPCYTTGRPRSPEEPASGATRSATLNDGIGFSNFFSYLTHNTIPLNSIGFSYGQKSDRDFTDTWSLGAGVPGQDWFASEDSTLEERIYQANPDDVEIVMTYGTSPLINFGYSPIYTVFDYGATTQTDDDFEAGFTEPVNASKVAGLNPLAAGLADAFLQDVALGGGSVQLFIEDRGIEDVNLTTGNGYNVIRLPFPASLRAVPSVAVPEPASGLGLLLLGALGAVFHRKKQRHNQVQ
ncbi:MAG: PEP-CTERM sorting domain-containing protein [Coleofasciculus sp. C1-SOL-03]|uniref:PEP-CTERM sorting domain-containing protein n=1 Tax=Coleofasciculus sp. C1-SOL-03 TaxID=3069522 RepID=UPI0032FA527A